MALGRGRLLHVLEMTLEPLVLVASLWAPPSKVASPRRT
jgi:hypothetical protein